LITAHLVPLPGSPTPEPEESLPDQAPSSGPSPQQTDLKHEATTDGVLDFNKTAEKAKFTFTFPPDVRLVTEPSPWSRPPIFLVQDGDAIVNERIRKAFCAESCSPLVLLRAYKIPTPASFGESRESLDARRAELKKAGLRFDVDPSTG
jgi:hypothetical protein